MAGASAQPVNREDILKAKLQLEVVVNRLEEALAILIEDEIPSILLRSRTALTKGITSVYGMATEVKSRAEDARVSSRMGVQTKASESKDRYRKYGKKKKP